MARIMDCAKLTRGKFPRAPRMPAESVWQVTKGKLKLQVKLRLRTIVYVDRSHRQFIGRQFEDLTRWLNVDHRDHRAPRLDLKIISHKEIR